MIAGVGIDMVEVARFRAAMEKRGERFLNRLFTRREIEYCKGRKDAALHLAGRFAAKVSVMKSVGGFSGAAGPDGPAVGFKGVEVMGGPSGRPAVSAPALDKTYRFSVTITHDGGFSMAASIAEFAANGRHEGRR